MRKYKVKEIEKWTMFWYYKAISEWKRINWLRTIKCQCKCWTIKEIRLSCLKSWNTTSCWCYCKSWNHKITHWMTWTREMYTWEWIQQRCNNPKHKRYSDYGWRGINCLWNSFEEFYKDMWDRPNWMTIERKDNDWHYCKKNCKWATNREQARNKRSSRLLTYKWKTKTMAEWCEILWLKYQTINTRINTYKWTTEKALWYGSFTA